LIASKIFYYWKHRIRLSVKLKKNNHGGVS
jgi:hypothetical protein